MSEEKIEQGQPTIITQSTGTVESKSNGQGQQTIPPGSPLANAISDSAKAIIQAKPSIDHEYKLGVEDTDILGRVQRTEIIIHDTNDWRSWGFLTRALIAKKGNKAWMDKSVAEILNALIFAESLGLSFEEGDVYTTPQGRLSTTASAKIKHAMNSGRIKTFKTTVQELEKDLQIPWTTFKDRGTFQHKELLSTTTVQLVNGETFVGPGAFLSEWFLGANENWRNRPRYMLAQNEASKTLTMVVPMGGAESEELPQEVTTGGVGLVVKPK